MLQEILMYLIVTAAFARALYSFAKFFVPVKNAGGACGSGCTSCGSAKPEVKVDFSLDFSKKHIKL